MTDDVPEHIENGEYCTNCERPLTLRKGIKVEKNVDIEVSTNLDYNRDPTPISNAMSNWTLCSRECLIDVLREESFWSYEEFENVDADEEYEADAGRAGVYGPRDPEFEDWREEEFSRGSLTSSDFGWIEDSDKVRDHLTGENRQPTPEVSMEEITIAKGLADIAEMFNGIIYAMSDEEDDDEEDNSGESK